MIYPCLLSLINLNNTLDNFLFAYLKNFLASSILLENDKKVFEKTIKPGKPSIFLFLYYILFILS